MRVFIGFVVVIVLTILARMSVYTVDASEYVYVTQLGRRIATHDGDKDAGLHFGWPWPIQALQRLDRRLQHFDLQDIEILTHDPEGKTVDRNLTVEAYVCWRIPSAEAVDLFIRRMGTAEKARSLLGPRINSQLSAEIGKMKMDELINTELDPKQGKPRAETRMDKLQQDLVARLHDQVLQEYGIQVVDIRLRRFNHPVRVHAAIFERIRSERDKKAAEYRSEGERQRRKIESETEEKVRNTLAEARFEEERLKGEADTKAVQVRNEAHSKDPEFYAFLKQLEKLQTILGDNKTVLLLSSHRPMFDLLFQPPRPNGTVAPPASMLPPIKPAPPKQGGP